MQDIALIASGFIVGGIIGMTGVGGGSLMTPLLIMAFGINPAIAVGTDLLFAAITKFGGTVKLAQRKLVVWRSVGHLCLGAIPATLITTTTLHAFGPASAAVTHLMRELLGAALLFTAIATVYNIAGFSGSQRDNRTDDDTRSAHWALPTLFGALIGTLVTLTSVGAGAIGVAALLLIFPQLSVRKVIAIDLAYAVPLTLIAGLGHASIGNVDWRLLALLIAGSLPGIWMGSRLLTRISTTVTRSILSALLATIGIKLLAF